MIIMIPLRYLPSDSMIGCRIGGPCPRGLESQFVDSNTQYFGTFSLVDSFGMEFSVFHRFDPKGIDDARDLISFNNRILRMSPLIWVIVHEKSIRSGESPNVFEARALQMESPAIDEVIKDGATSPHPGCKLGGRCFVQREQVSEAVFDLEKSGLVHLLQISEVGGDLIEGFPWDPGCLNVWARDARDASTYRFCVQQ